MNQFCCLRALRFSSVRRTGYGDVDDVLWVWVWVWVSCLGSYGFYDGVMDGWTDGLDDTLFLFGRLLVKFQGSDLTGSVIRRLPCVPICLGRGL